jgi:hypothetical protein
MNLTTMKQDAFQMQVAIRGIIDEIGLLERETHVHHSLASQGTILSSLSDIISKARSIRENIKPPQV